MPVLEFTTPVRAPLNLAIFGTIVNSVVESKRKDELRAWQVKVASKVKGGRGEGPWNHSNDYLISLGLSFHLPSHGNRKFDVDNFTKPIIDAVAVGLFCPQHIKPEYIPKFDYPDSNFNTLLIHRLPDADSPQYEGVAIYVSASPQ